MPQPGPGLMRAERSIAVVAGHVGAVEHNVQARIALEAAVRNEGRHTGLGRG